MAVTRDPLNVTPERQFARDLRAIADAAIERPDLHQIAQAAERLADARDAERQAERDALADAAGAGAP